MNRTLAIALGSAYANDLSHEWQVQRVFLRVGAVGRPTRKHVLPLRVRGPGGEMVPVSAFIERYNGYRAITIAGQVALGASSSAALDTMGRLVGKHLNGSLAFEWTGTAYENRQAGRQIDDRCEGDRDLPQASVLRGGAQMAFARPPTRRGASRRRHAGDV